MSNNDNVVALITGASSGIGPVTAKALQRASYRVFGTSGRAIVLVNGRDESAKCYDETTASDGIEGAGSFALSPPPAQLLVTI